MADVAARPLHEPILHRAVPPPSTGAFPLSRPSGILVVMAVTLRVEEYGFMVFPEVFDGPRWAEYPAAKSGRRGRRSESPNAEPQEPRRHVAEVVVEDSATLADVLNKAHA